MQPIFDWNFTYHGTGGANVGFQVSDMDEIASTKYYGFLASDGHWLIMEKTVNSVRYCMGHSGYKTATTGAWARRAALSYVHYNELFYE